MHPVSIVKNAFRAVGFELSRITPAKRMAQDAYYAQQALLSSGQVRTVFDVGANTGQTLLKYKSLFPGAVIHSFEPGEPAHGALVAAHGGDANVHIHPLAISDRIGSTTFFRNRDDTTNSLLPSAPGVSALTGRDTMTNVDSVEVSVTTLDDFTEKRGITQIDLLKMDIQGGELMALRGAERLLASQRISLIYSEVLFAELYSNQGEFTEIAGELRRHGYQLFGLYDLHYIDQKGIGWGDAIFVKPSLVAR